MRSLLRISLVLALGLCSSPLVAQDDAAVSQQAPPVKPATPPKPPAPTGSIHGIVYCGDTHKPARGALVMAQNLSSDRAQNNNPGMTRTAMDGSYTIANVAEGEYGVVAFLPGYLSPFDNISADEMEGEASMIKRFAAAGTANVTAKQPTAHDITLTRGATISGRVLFSDGSPASQVNISIEDINAKAHKLKPGQPDIDFSVIFKAMFTHQASGTDDEGNFRISGLSTATYRVAAVSASTLSMDGDGGEDGIGTLLGGMFSDPNALHVYSGDTLHKNAAKTYELRAGDNITGVDIVIPLNAFHQVRGILSAIDGRAINTANLTLVDAADDTLHFNAKVAADGVFTFTTVPSGTYKLSAARARIVEHDPNSPAYPERFAPKIPIAAFADGDTTIIVKDTDLLDVTFTLTEIPIPADETKPNNQPPSPEQPE